LLDSILPLLLVLIETRRDLNLSGSKDYCAAL
jgi:hypothetical protein